MDIEISQKCLGEVDIAALRGCILEQEPAAWQEQLLRQQEYEVHRDTESIVLLFCDEEWPEGEIYREAGWDRLSDVAMPLIDHIIELDTRDDLYLETLRQTPLYENQLNHSSQLDRLLGFFDRIFATPITPVAVRRRRLNFFDNARNR